MRHRLQNRSNQGAAAAKAGRFRDWLENEGWRRDEARQHTRRSIKDRAADHLTFNHVIDHRLACRGAAANPDHAAVWPELPPKRFGCDFHGAIEQDHVIGRAGRPAGSQGPDDDLNVARANRGKRNKHLRRLARATLRSSSGP